jgi:hypothetical protein
MRPIVKLQVPPLCYAPVGMTKWRALAHLGMGGDGWTVPTDEGPTLNTYALDQLPTEQLI